MGKIVAKLYIIDDDKLITSTYADFFAAKGYIVAASNTPFGVTTGIKALAPDVVLVAMNLPGLGGTGLLSIIDYEGSFKIMLLSGASQFDEMKALTESGQADDFFIKGEPLARLADKITRLLGANKGAVRRKLPAAEVLSSRHEWGNVFD